MTITDFFSPIPQVKALLGDLQFDTPVFYYDTLSLEILVLGPIRTIRKILPSERMHPLRITPWHTVVAFSAYQYRDSGIGPYNEVSISVPFSMDKPSPILAGVTWTPKEPLAYIVHLPVTSEIARAAGVRSANFPKFLADITFETNQEWITCSLNADGKNILTLAGRKIKTGPAPRQRVYPVTLKDDHLLRLESILSECEMGSSMIQTDARLELGNHPIAEELKGWGLGRVLRYQYCPTRQSILTPVFESYSLRPGLAPVR